MIEYRENDIPRTDEIKKYMELSDEEIDRLIEEKMNEQNKNNE